MSEKSSIAELLTKEHLSTDSEEKPIISDVDPLKYFQHDALSNHAKGKTFICEICSKVFFNSRDLKNHFRMHTGEKPFICEVCSKVFSQELNLKRHLNSHTGEKTFICDICSKGFFKNGDLKKHLRTHSGEKPFVCDLCSKTFAHMGHLKEHIRIHTKEKPFSCEMCFKAFSRYGHLKLHLRTHTGEKPFVCDFCSKGFLQNHALKLHLCTHTGEKSFICDFCSKGFSKSYELKRHLHTHTSEKPFICEVCSKGFFEKGHLNEHIRVHTKEQPFSCEMCSRRFSKIGNLKQHVRIHTKEKPFTCEVCSKGFSLNANLKRHLSIHTGFDTRLSNNSVVSAVTAYYFCGMSNLVNESNGDVSDFNSLPDEVILEIFSYIKQNQLGQIAKVCRRWNALTKSPVLWIKVNVKISPSHTSQTTTIPKSFFNILPSCVTSVRLDFAGYKNWTEPLDFEELCIRLEEKCPHLETLILTDSELSGSLNSVITLCARFLPNVKNLVIHRSSFLGCLVKEEFVFTSKIEVLDLSGCSNIGRFNRPPFSIMHHLKELCLYGTDVNNSWCQDDGSFLTGLHVLNLGGTWIGSRTFQAVQKHGIHLKELYICLVNLQDNDLRFKISVFPQLETICLRGYCVTCEGIVSLLQSCPTLQNIHVEEDVAESFASHPFVGANTCKSGIVKAIAWDHNHNVNYLNN